MRRLANAAAEATIVLFLLLTVHLLATSVSPPELVDNSAGFLSFVWNLSVTLVPYSLSLTPFALCPILIHQIEVYPRTQLRGIGGLILLLSLIGSLSYKLMSFGRIPVLGFIMAEMAVPAQIAFFAFSFYGLHRLDVISRLPKHRGQRLSIRLDLDQ